MKPELRLNFLNKFEMRAIRARFSGSKEPEAEIKPRTQATPLKLCLEITRVVTWELIPALMATPNACRPDAELRSGPMAKMVSLLCSPD
jgi:hypothetical protein